MVPENIQTPTTEGISLFDWNDLHVGRKITPFTLIGNVVPFQLTGTPGRDIWTQLVHFCLGLTVIRILINFDLHIIRK